jgi:serine/threonine protein kinase
MQIYNLKSKILTSEKTVDEKKLYNILHRKILDKTNFQLKNKTQNNTANNIYDIKLNKTRYLLKTLLNSKLSNMNKQINNMTLINNNDVVKQYILECKYLVRTNDVLISIFEYVNSMLLKDFINRLHTITDTKKKEKLQRYLIISLLKSISDLHKANICHLQINVNNILVSINNNYNNSNIYSTEYPLNIKFINFNLQFNNRPNKFINTSILQKLDPFINYKANVSLSLINAKKYDIWCISLIIFKIILLPNEYINFVKNIINKTSISNLTITINDNVRPVYNNLDKYVLTELKNRKTADFILNKIILDEKHN